MLFDVDYDAGVWRNLPVRLRKSVMFAWLKCLVAPVKYVYSLCAVNRTANLYVLTHSSQVCRIEAVLNDTFDPIDREIYLSDVAILLPVYTYRPAELKPVYLGTKPLYMQPETLMYSAQFAVNVPVAVQAAAGYSEVRLRALVNQYRLASKALYNVVYF